MEAKQKKKEGTGREGIETAEHEENEVEREKKREDKE